MNAIHPVSAAQSFTPSVWAFVARVMKPVIRIFLRLGFSAEQISQMVRKLAVDVAMEHEEFRPPNRKRAFIAHAAVVTGLSRKEVSKLHDLGGVQHALDTRQVNRSVRVLAGWRNDQRYRDAATGKPLAVLPFKAASGVSFHQLVREYGGDIPPRAVLDTLVQRGAVVRNGKKVELVRDYPTRATGPEEEMEFLGIMLSDAIGTAEFDLRPGTSRRFFHEWYQSYVPVERTGEAQIIIREETMAFGRKVDERLADLAHRAPKANVEYRRVGLGAFFFESEESS